MKAQFNKSEIFKAAWKLVKSAGKTLSDALKAAWALAKKSTAATYRASVEVGRSVVEILIIQDNTGARVSRQTLNAKWYSTHSDEQIEAEVLAMYPQYNLISVVIF